jgi:anti-anti-sigma regulatory factor
MDCSGIRMLVAAHATAQLIGCQMWARHPQRLVHLMLEVTEVLDQLTPQDISVVATGIEDGGCARPARLAMQPATFVAV